MGGSTSGAEGARTADPFYLTPAWRRLRAEVLKRDLLCVLCNTNRATHADHIKPRRLFPQLELAASNIRGLCTSCHNSRSARQYSSYETGLNGEPIDPSHPWNAGEQTRVTFKGAQRAPLAWQLPLIAAAAMDGTPGVTQQHSAQTGRIGATSDYAPMSVPRRARGETVQ